MHKRGLSTTIATLVIILLAITSTIIIYNVTKSSINEAGTFVDLQQKCLFTEIKLISCTNTTNEVILNVQLLKGDVKDIVGIVEFEDGSTNLTRVFAPDILATTKLIINKSSNNKEPKIAKVVAVVADINGEERICELSKNIECANSVDNSQCVPEICNDIDDNCDGFVNENLDCQIISGNGFYGMKVLFAQKNEDNIIVETTGARYVLRSNEMEMWRKIDPAINDVNPRLVNKISFNTLLTDFNISKVDSEEVIVGTNLAEFNFKSDSLFFIKSKEQFSYKHQNLVSNLKWARTGETYLDRMWADNSGGSLHANVSGSPEIISQDTNSTTISMNVNDTMAHMAFPPKPYDFKNLYGENSRPHVVFVRDYNELANLTLEKLENYANDGFGVVMLWATLYNHPSRDDSIPDNRQMYLNTTGSMIYETPRLLESGYMGYLYNDSQKIKEFVNLAHQKSFKVITYMTAPRTVFQQKWWKYPEYNLTGAVHSQAEQYETIEKTLEWMRSFQNEFDLDGWYFDNSNAGDFMKDYDFIKQVRKNVGDDGIIYHHSTRDVWGQNKGLRAIFVNAYVNYILKGEVFDDLSAIDSPNDEVLRYYSVGYGFSQAYTSYKRHAYGQGALSEGEMLRMLGENFHGSARKNNVLQYSSWYDYFQPFYEMRKAEYLSGTLQKDIDWPIDPTTGWFREPQNIRINYPSTTSAEINWTTAISTDSSVSTGENMKFWPPEAQVNQTNKVKQHSIRINGLRAGINYWFRIRSSNREPPTSEIIFGKVIRDFDRNNILDD